LITHLILFCPSLAFGLYYLVRGEINISRLREMTTSEAVEHAVEDEKIELGDEHGPKGDGGIQSAHTSAL